MARVFIGLGGNLGKPQHTLEAALIALQHLPETQLIAHAPLYETIPIGLNENESAPAFVNTAAELNTDLSPQDLLTELLKLEILFGRERPQDGSMVSRTLDLDLLFYDDLMLHDPTLEIPHPRLHERGFVLVPLCALAPSFVHPRFLQTVQTLLTALAPEAIAGIRALGMPASII